MWRMQLEIRTQNSAVAEEVKNSAPLGVSVSIGYLMTRSVTDPGCVIVTLQFIRDKAIEVDIALLAAWLYDKTKNDKTCQISKGRKKVIKTKAGIGRWIQEELKIANKD
jgi:hypothetical protein